MTLRPGAIAAGAVEGGEEVGDAVAEGGARGAWGAA